ncbi:MAG: anion transporter [Actinobacteria bacterium]|nr:anion transporter [Actinomycetota bacterium]
MNLPIAVLLAVFALIAARGALQPRLSIWQIVLLGALAVLATGQIGPLEALQAIDVDVMLFLFGVFVIGQALEASGVLSHLAYQVFRVARTDDQLVLAVLFGGGVTSALLMNDTLAIVGTPVVIRLARAHGMSPKLLLQALAFAVTTGSVMSPIGNPQNLLIAIHGGLTNPFATFLQRLAAPTLINLGLTYLVLNLFYRNHLGRRAITHVRDRLHDPALARLARIALALLAAGVVAKVVLVFAAPQIELRLTYVALAPALVILTFARRRLAIVQHIDWPTLVFFAALFVLVASVWATGLVQTWVAAAPVDLGGVGAIMGVSVLGSQLVSNVPLVALYLPLLQAGDGNSTALVALAAGSTLAGNLLILGAASNVIIIQTAERRFQATLTFWEFARVGVPLTVANAAIYAGFLSLG